MRAHPHQATAREAGAKPRDWAESQLQFAGFVAFSCLARKDTEAVVGALKQAGQHQAMITGDAPLTALQVAAEVRRAWAYSACLAPVLGIGAHAFSCCGRGQAHALQPSYSHAVSAGR